MKTKKLKKAVSDIPWRVANSLSESKAKKAGRRVEREAERGAAREVEGARASVMATGVSALSCRWITLISSVR